VDWLSMVAGRVDAVDGSVGEKLSGQDMFGVSGDLK
jgi:hypothetical protein